MPDTRIDLLRHGQCEGGDVFRGSLDVSLTPEGWANMRARLAARPGPPWHRIVSSPLKRCLDFARDTAEHLSLPLEIEPDLREMHFGDWEGRAYAHLWETDPQLQRWGQDPERYTPPGGEPLADFARRVLEALERVAHNHAGEHLLIVTHGGVIRLLQTRALGLPRNRLRDMEAPYAHFVPLRWRQGKLTPMENSTSDA